jgi:hypothetical protein
MFGLKSIYSSNTVAVGQRRSIGTIQACPVTILDKNFLIVELCN